MISEASEATQIPENKEKGCNIRIVLKIIRHGERTKEGLLTDYGREITRQKSQESGIQAEDYDAIKAIGSNVDAPENGIGRSLETADIYAKEIAGEEAFTTRARNLLNYKSILSPAPYNHKEIYNSFLPENFAELSDVEKAQVAKMAQIGTVNHLLSLRTPEAINYKKEVTGAHAELINHYIKTAGRLKSGSNVLMTAGGHGGSIELPLEAALVRVENGEKKIGFETIEEIGGEMDPSEAYNVIIETDEKGELQPLKVTFDNPNRPQEEMYLDREILEDARIFFEEVHEEKGWEM